MKRTLTIILVLGMILCAFASCGGDKAILLVEGAGHGVSFLKDKQAYRACVRSILTKAFGEAYELRNNQKL